VENLIVFTVSKQHVAGIINSWQAAKPFPINTSPNAHRPPTATSCSPRSTPNYTATYAQHQPRNEIRLVPSAFSSSLNPIPEAPGPERTDPEVDDDKHMLLESFFCPRSRRPAFAHPEMWNAASKFHRGADTMEEALGQDGKALNLKRQPRRIFSPQL
jgi:hypothetical protein